MANGKTPEAFDQIKLYFEQENKDVDNLYFMLSNEQSRLDKRITLGTIREEERNRQQNSINLRLLELIDDL